MSRSVQFVTPENIEISYELAGIGTRCIAVLIDHLIQTGAILVLSIGGSFLAGAAGGAGALIGFSTAPQWVAALMMLIVFVVIFGYFPFFELRWAGRTPGKKIVGLRVVRDGGYPLDPYASIVRNLVRVVDLLPPMYGAGLASIFLSEDYKRLGDWAAGTVVIKERSAAGLGGRHGPLSPTVAHFIPLIRNLDAITADEFGAIRRFVERRHELEIPIQAHIAMRLALPIMRKTGLDLHIPIQWHYADLLEAIERRCVEERGLL